MSLEFIHRGGGTPGTIYRLAVGLSMLVMVVSGSMVFLRSELVPGKIDAHILEESGKP